MTILRSGTILPPPRGLKPQGVGSGGFNSPGLHWFGFVLLVIILTMTHAASILADGARKEVLMEMNTVQAALNKARPFFFSLITTMSAIGTSAAAGALSA